LTSARQPPLIAPQIPASLEEQHKLPTSPQLSYKPPNMDMGYTGYSEYYVPTDPRLYFPEKSNEGMQQEFKEVTHRRIKTEKNSTEERLDSS